MKNRVSVKFTPPVLDRIWHRNRLFKLLEASDSTRLIWVSAPAGFGKTSLIADYINTHCSSHLTLWYRMDEADSDLGSFLYHLNLWVKKLPSFAKSKLPVYEESAVSDIKAYLRLLCRSLVSHIDSDTKLVFDDAHLLEHSPWFINFILLLVQEASVHLQIFIISRHQYPDGVLPVLAKNQLLSISQQAMTLTENEVVEITSRLGKKQLSDGELKHIYSLTKGWISAIILLLNQDNTENLDAFSDGGILPLNISSFLLVEIFQQLPKDAQIFLLHTSVMRRFNIHMATRLTNNSDSAEILAWLTQRNYFTYEYKGFPSEYEYHSLMRSFLSTCREENLSTEEQLKITQSAALISEENQYFDQAFSLYMSLQDWNSVCRLLLKLASEYFKSGRAHVLLDWLNAVPVEFLEKLSWLMYWKARCLQESKPKLAVPVYEAAYAQFRGYNDFEGSLLSCAGVLEALALSCDDFTQVESWLENYRYLRKGAASKISLETKIQTTGSVVLTMCTGQINVPWMERNLRYCDYAFHFVPLTSSRVMIGSFLGLYYGMMGEVGKLKALVHHLRPAIDKFQGQALTKVIGYLVLVLHDMLTLSPEVKKTSMQGLDFSAETGIHLFDELFHAYAGYSDLISNHPADAVPHFAIQGELANAERRMQLGHYIFVLAWQALVNGELVTAVEHAEKALQLAREIGFSFGESLTASLLSNIYLALGDSTGCVELLDCAEAIAIQTKSALLLFSATAAKAWFLQKQGDEAQAKGVLSQAFNLASNKELYCFGGWYPPMMNDLAGLAIRNDIALDYSYKLIQKHSFVPEQSAVIEENWPWKMRVTVLGRFEVICAQQNSPVELQKRAQELLQLLIVEGGVQVSYEKIIAKLWPDVEADAALSALETTLYRLRKIIGKDLIQVKHSLLSIDRNHCWCDLWAVNEVLKSLKQQTVSKGALDNILTLYKGPLLSGLESFWVIPTRDRVHAEVMHALEEVLSLMQASSEKEQLLLKGIELDPLHETFYLLLMQHYESLGQSAKIISTYQRLKGQLLAELNVAPAVAISALAQKYLLESELS